MQDRARVVIIGAGIVGCGVAYYLTEMGWRDIVVLEQGPLFETGGSTSHAPGLVYQTNPSRAMAEFAKQTVELYSSLEADGQPGWLPVGSLEVACSPERLEELKRRAGLAASWGIDAQVIGPAEARERLPLLGDVVLGALHVPGDGIAHATVAAEAMSRYSQANGAAFYAHTAVTGIEVSGGRVRAVLTDRGRIETETVLAAAGIWGPTVGRMAGVAIPLFPMQHLLAWTAPLPELRGETAEATHPILRRQERAVYFRQRGEGYAIGSYQHEPIVTDPEDIMAHGDAPEMPSVMPWTPSHFRGALESAGEILPALRDVELVHKINGMFSFTPDAMPLLGESPEVQGFWSAHAVWITQAGRRSQGRGRVDGPGRTHRRPEGVRHRQVPSPRPGERLRAHQVGPAVPGGVRHPAPAGADPGAPGAAAEPLPPEAGGAWGRLLRERRMGAAPVVRGQRRPAPARLAGALWMGGALLVAGRGRRARGRQEERGPVRPDGLHQAGGLRAGRLGIPPVRRRQRDGQARWAGSPTPRCSTRAAASSAT